MNLGGTFGVGATEITKKSIPNAEMRLGAKKAKQSGKGKGKNKNQVEVAKVEVASDEPESTEIDTILNNL